MCYGPLLREALRIATDIMDWWGGKLQSDLLFLRLLSHQSLLCCNLARANAQEQHVRLCSDFALLLLQLLDELCIELVDGPALLGEDELS